MPDPLSVPANRAYPVDGYATMSQPRILVDRVQPTCRVIVDPPAPGAWNMAVDEALLAAAADECVATLRLYQWSEPTLSLGYFQRYDDRLQHAPSSDCAAVRRQTGGGAILHDRELTYSLTLPADHPLLRDSQRLYAAVHTALARLLTPFVPRTVPQWVLRVHAAADRSTAVKGNADEPFLCFARRSQGDLLLVAGLEVEQWRSAPVTWKIVGSAQRRRRGVILQHGSILLERSPAAPELPGWRELTGAALPTEALISELPQQLADVFSNRWVATLLPAAIRDAAGRIERQKYASRSWTRRR